MPVLRWRPSPVRIPLIGGLLAGIALVTSLPASAAPAESASQNSDQTRDTGDGKEENNNGYDLTRPENSIDLRFQYRDTLREDTETEREFAFLRLTSRIPPMKTGSFPFTLKSML